MVTASRPDGDDDRALVRRMRAGDEHAFEHFFELYFQAVFRFAMSRLGRDQELAKEMAQATLCTALEKLHLFRGEARLFTWLCAICRFEISAHRRRDRGTRSEPFEDAALERATQVPAALVAENPERRLLAGEVARQVQDTVAELPPHYAQVLTWKYTEGVSVNEIASRLGTSAKAAESLLTRAREAFRSLFPGDLRAAGASLTEASRRTRTSS